MTERPEAVRADTIGSIMNSMAVVRREGLELLSSVPNVPGPAQRELIGILMRHPEGVSMKDIARIAKVTSSAATQRVELLEERGLVEKHVLPNDNRYTTVVLSSLGRRQVEESLTQFARSLDASCMHALNAKELQTLQRLLVKVAHVLEPA